MFEQPLAIKKIFFGDKHIELAQTYNSMANLYEKLNRPEKAIELFLAATNIADVSKRQFSQLVVDDQLQTIHLDSVSESKISDSK